MKLFAVLFVVSVFVVAQAIELTREQKDRIKAHHVECAKSSNVDEEVVKKTRTGVFTNDPKLKEHLLCMSKKFGFQNEAGDLDVEAIKKKLKTQLTDEQVENAVTKCVIKKDTPQETAFELTKCWRTNAIRAGA